MAPEQIVGAATDCRCDIYAFGIVLYELCSQGAYPYEIVPPITSSTFVTAHLRGVVRPLASPFWPLIDRCLKRFARDRWQSPGDLTTAIYQVAKEMRLPCPPFVSPQPVDLEELYTKAQSLTALGRPKDALAAVEQYLSKAPDASWAWTEKGRIHMELNQNVEAEEATRRALALDSTSSHTWNNLGLILQRLNRSEESCSAYDRALECDPLNGGAMMNAARSLCALGRHERAATFLCTALNLTPRKQTLLFNAGNLVGLMLQGRAFDSAERVARALIAANADDSQAWHNLGVIHIAKGKRTEGLHYVRTALQFEPGNTDSRLFLAHSCGEAGLFDEAMSHLDRLIVDRQQMVDQVLAGFGSVANDLFAPLDSAYIGDELDQRDQDIPAAMALLADAGQADMTVDLLAPNDTAGLPEMIQAFSTMAADAGITVNPVVMDGSYWGDEYLKRPFGVDYWGTRNFLAQVASSSLPTAPYPDDHWPNGIDATLAATLGVPETHVRPESTFLTDYNDAVGEVDPVARKVITDKMQHELFEEGGLIIPFFQNQLDGFNKRVVGLVERANTLNLDHYGRGWQDLSFAAD